MRWVIRQVAYGTFHYWTGSWPRDSSIQTPITSVYPSQAHDYGSEQEAKRALEADPRLVKMGFVVAEIA